MGHCKKERGERERGERERRERDEREENNSNYGTGFCQEQKYFSHIYASFSII